ncbi:unannotated protein [freshwater metagenome]|uniref:Unannotated protein n=1 Tax=freshwater metagenome TaxID=449393 RepID=A0A6J6YEL9_9ZZZZ
MLAEPQPCVTYQIEGTIDSTDTTSLDTTSPEQKRQAEVYVHFGEKPLVRHQVFVTFAGVMDQILGEPVLLVTDELGRATVEVPLGAVNVAFMTESPGPENCSVSIGVEREPVIVAARIPVQPSVDGPVGLDQGVTYADIYDTAPFVNQTGNVDVPAPELAHTGPVSRVVLLVSTVIFAAGIGLGMGRGRQAARAER